MSSLWVSQECCACRTSSRDKMAVNIDFTNQTTNAASYFQLHQIRTVNIPKYSLVVTIFNSGLYHRVRHSWLLHFDQLWWHTNWHRQPAALWLAATCCNTLWLIKKINMSILCHSLVVGSCRSRIVLVTKTEQVRYLQYTG